MPLVNTVYMPVRSHQKKFYIFGNMKILLITLCMFAGHTLTAQTVKYYDYKWKECDISLARFFSVKQQTDSGWLVEDSYLATKKLQMKGLYKDEACKITNGKFTYFYPNQQISSTGYYSNGKRNGIWLSFHYNGMMRDSTNYEKGAPKAISLGWHDNGVMADSTVYGVNGLDVHVYWFDNGNPSSSGRTLNDKKQGTWRYFHKNGNTAALEKYDADVLISRTYYDEQGTQLADTSNRDHDAVFKGNQVKWKNYMENNLVFPRGVKLVNADVITVVLVATVSEEGKVENVYVDIPFDPLFDDEALRVMKRSPKWVAAIDHNRSIKTIIRQAVSFSQD